MFLHLRAAMRLFLFAQVRYTQKQGCILGPDKSEARG
jgi:hypothetical protein